MSDMNEKFGIDFEEGNPEKEGFEIVNEEDQVEEQEVEAPLSKEEIAELRRKADSVSSTKETFNLISEQLKSQNRSQAQAPVNVSPQGPTESDEEYAKRFEEEMFKPGQGYAAMRGVIAREIAPHLHSLQQMTVQQSKRLLELDPDKGTYFKKYKEDIENTVRSLPPGQQVTPGVYEWAYDRVISSKQSEIVEDQVSARINDKVEELVKKKLEEMGISDTGERRPAARPRSYSESSSSAPSSRPAPNRQRVIATADDRRNAEEKGLSLQDYLVGIGKIK